MWHIAALLVVLNIILLQVDGARINHPSQHRIHLTHARQPHHKVVVAHFMVGNTFPYQLLDWVKDISLASSKGIDAFALNIGSDPWQPDRVADAYRAAKAVSNSNKLLDHLSQPFKLFLSFDMSAIPCASASDGNLIRHYVDTYHAHPNQLIYAGQPFYSTFAGEGCTFGAGDLNEGWMDVMKKNPVTGTHFVPSFFIDPARFHNVTAMDGAFSWNSAWPLGNTAITFDYDREYLSHLSGRTYMAGVSPWFFTHYGRDTYNKNFIYRPDHWLFASRWELLTKQRDSIDLAQVITWNDYGESHYVGPIEGAQPNSQAWTNGFDHQGWLDLMHYYIIGFKTGVYPVITRDRIFLWGRLSPAQANTPDPIGKPTNYDITQDAVWAVILLPTPAHIKLTCGPSIVSMELPSGLSKISLPLTRSCSVVAVLYRRGKQVLVFAPKGYTFTENPSNYNFNAFVAASP